MGHHVQAIVGLRSALEAHAGDFPSIRIIPLPLKRALIPLTDELLEEIGDTGSYGGFFKLTTAGVSWLQRLSISTPVAYFETDYFGGRGNQSVAVWRDGMEILARLHEENAINRALSLLGIRPSLAGDEFETLELSRHRHTDAWLPATPPPFVEGFMAVFIELLNGAKPDLYQAKVSLAFERIAKWLFIGLRPHHWYDGVNNLEASRRKARQVIFSGAMWVGDSGGGKQWTEPFEACVTDKRSTRQGIWISMQIGDYHAEGDLLSIP